MKTLVTSLLVCLLCFEAFAQKKITIEEVSQHVQDSVSILDRVQDVYFDKTRNVTLIRLGSKPSAQLLLISNVRQGSDIKNKIVLVTGRIRKYDDVFEMVITQPEQIRILEGFKIDR